MTRPFATPLFALIMLVGSSVAAEESANLDQVMAHDQRAGALFAEEQYEGALEELRAAQNLLPSSARLYNMALCEAALGNSEEAIELFEQFIDAEDIEESQREDATRRLEELRINLEEAAPDVDPVVDPDTTPDSEQQSDPATETSSGLSPAAFFSTLGVTVAFGVTTAVLGGIVLSRHGEFEEMTQSDSTVGQLADEGQRLTMATNVFIGLTAATAAASLILVFFTRWSSEDETESISLVPSIGVGGGQLNILGRF